MGLGRAVRGAQERNSGEGCRAELRCIGRVVCGEPRAGIAADAEETTEVHLQSSEDPRIKVGIRNQIYGILGALCRLCCGLGLEH